MWSRVIKWFKCWLPRSSIRELQKYVAMPVYRYMLVSHLLYVFIGRQENKSLLKRKLAL